MHKFSRQACCCCWAFCISDTILHFLQGHRDHFWFQEKHQIKFLSPIGHTCDYSICVVLVISILLYKLFFLKIIKVACPL